MLGNPTPALIPSGGKYFSYGTDTPDSFPCGGTYLLVSRVSAMLLSNTGPASVRGAVQLYWASGDSFGVVRNVCFKLCSCIEHPTTLAPPRHLEQRCSKVIFYCLRLALGLGDPGGFMPISAHDNMVKLLALLISICTLGY